MVHILKMYNSASRRIVHLLLLNSLFLVDYVKGAFP